MSFAQGSRLTSIGGINRPIPITIRRSYGRKKWSKKVTTTSAALSLAPGLFKRDSKTIAKAIKRAVEHKDRCNLLLR